MRPATCHPERPHYARGLCASCYTRVLNGAEQPEPPRVALGRRAVCLHTDRPPAGLVLCAACVVLGRPTCYTCRTRGRRVAQARGLCEECMVRAEQQARARGADVVGCPCGGARDGRSPLCKTCRARRAAQTVVRCVQCHTRPRVSRSIHCTACREAMQARGERWCHAGQHIVALADWGAHASRCKACHSRETREHPRRPIWRARKRYRLRKDGPARRRYLAQRRARYALVAERERQQSKVRTWRRAMRGER